MATSRPTPILAQPSSYRPPARPTISYGNRDRLSPSLADEESSPMGTVGFELTVFGLDHQNPDSARDHLDLRLLLNTLPDLRATWRLCNGPDRTRRLFFAFPNDNEAQSMLEPLREWFRARHMPIMAERTTHPPSTSQTRISFDLFNANDVDRAMREHPRFVVPLYGGEVAIGGIAGLGNSGGTTQAFLHDNQNGLPTDWFLYGVSVGKPTLLFSFNTQGAPPNPVSRPVPFPASENVIQPQLDYFRSEFGHFTSTLNTMFDRISQAEQRLEQITSDPSTRQRLQAALESADNRRSVVVAEIEQIRRETQAIRLSLAAHDHSALPLLPTPTTSPPAVSSLAVSSPSTSPSHPSHVRSPSPNDFAESRAMPRPRLQSVADSRWAPPDSDSVTHKGTISSSCSLPFFDEENHSKPLLVHAGRERGGRIQLRWGYEDEFDTTFLEGVDIGFDVRVSANGRLPVVASNGSGASLPQHPGKVFAGASARSGDLNAEATRCGRAGETTGCAGLQVVRGTDDKKKRTPDTAGIISENEAMASLSITYKEVSNAACKGLNGSLMDWIGSHCYDPAGFGHVSVAKACLVGLRIADFTRYSVDSHFRHVVHTRIDTDRFLFLLSSARYQTAEYFVLSADMSWYAELAAAESEYAADVNRMLDESSQLELHPGDRVNINKCKTLQCEFEGEIEERKNRMKSKADENIQAGRSVENASDPSQDKGVPEVVRSAKAKGNGIPQDTEMSIDGCDRCVSKQLSCTGVKGQACPRCVEKKKNCNFSNKTRKAKNIPQEQASSRKRQSPPSQGADPSFPQHKRWKGTLANDRSRQPQSSPEPSALVSPFPPFQNNPHHSLAPVPDVEQIPGATASATRSVCLAQAVASIRLANAEVISLQHAATNMVSYLVELEMALRLLQNEEANASNDSFTENKPE
ncbi:hypothetical protein EDD15DRAFT_2205321 [Pisolithus albus]|nr:hypothetical protein EDD15DRAFT_2205321 [Pisolithus albus]